MNKAPFIGIKRHRLFTDGRGITTLVAFHGCPLHCTYCLNERCHHQSGIDCELSPLELFNKVKVDELYYRATGGGLTFGGGEPLIYPQFIKEVLDLGARKWHTTIETCLNVPRSEWEYLVDDVDEFIIDIKDMNNSIYKKYTSQEIYLMEYNLRWIAQQGLQDRVMIRVPLIHLYNTLEDRHNSVEKLRALGYQRFDMFEYRVKKSWWADKREKHSDRCDVELMGLVGTPIKIKRYKDEELW